MRMALLCPHWKGSGELTACIEATVHIYEREAFVNIVASRVVILHIRTCLDCSSLGSLSRLNAALTS